MTQSPTTVAPFSWSYSVLKNFETCPKRYYHYNVMKDVVEPQTDQLRDGNRLHHVFDERLKGKPLPLGFAQFENMLGRIVAAPGETHSEQKLAITSSFTPTTWFGNGAWFRGVIDCTKINGPVASIFDWKTGKPAEDLTQLQLLAATIFIHAPQVERVKAGLVFVGHNHVEPAEFVRDDTKEIWGEILPRVRQVERARQAQEFPPKPSGLCKKYCAVVSCPYHGRGA